MSAENAEYRVMYRWPDGDEEVYGEGVTVEVAQGWVETARAVDTLGRVFWIERREIGPWRPVEGS